VIGSVSASEFIVSASASVGFLLGLGSDFFDNLLIIAGLALGGVIAAPIAAWLVSRITPGVLGTGVGGLLILTNARTLFKHFDIEGAPRTIGYVLIVVVAVALTVLAWRKSRTAPAAGDTAETTGADAAEPAVAGSVGTDAAGEGSADATQVPVR
jgi:hypothetical protein